MPFTQIEPFSITNSANFFGNSNSNSQLPSFHFFSYKYRGIHMTLYKMTIQPAVQ